MPSYVLAVMAVATVSFAGVALADDAAQPLLDQAMDLFTNQRADLSKNDQVISLCEQVVAKAQDNQLKYDALVLESHAYYWKGVNVPGDEENNPAKLPAFSTGIDKANQAIQLNNQYADAYYYYSINLSRWGLAKGKLNALFRLGELKDHLNSTLSRLTEDGDPGETIDGYGPDRVYGRMYNVLPGIAGGSNDKANHYLEIAYNKAPENALNVVYYASLLADMHEKDQAISILQNLLKQDPNTYNPDRVPETKLDFADGQKLLSQLTK